MKKLVFVLCCLVVPLMMGADGGCKSRDTTVNQDVQDHKTVARQQEQYAARQPIPVFDWSLERDNVIQLYHMRNQQVATHAVWRSDMGMIEGDCPSVGFGIPYDVSLTNPLQPEVFAGFGEYAAIAVGQAEPNGVYASTNTAATWVLCAAGSGKVAPVYVESKVTVYPGHVEVDYATNRVRFGDQMHTIKVGR